MSDYNATVSYEELMGSLESMQSLLDVLGKSYFNIAMQLEQAKTAEHEATKIDTQLANTYVMYPLIQLFLQIINNKETNTSEEANIETAKAFAISVNNSLVVALKIDKEPQLKASLLDPKSEGTIYNLLEYLQTAT